MICAVALRRDAKVELLKKVPLFAGCSKAELRELARSADELDIREGTVLTREGRPGREFFVLISGNAQVTRKAKKIAEIGPGDWFGEIALLTDSPRTATVTATSPGDILVITDRRLPQRRRDDAVDRAEGAVVRGRPTRPRREELAARPARRQRP